MARRTVLQYARHHGLAVDHRSITPELEIASLLDGSSLCTVEEDPSLWDDESSVDTMLSHLFKLELDVLREEKFKLNLNQSRLLHAAITVPDLSPPIGSPEFWASVLPYYGQYRKLKVPEPLLVSGRGDAHKDTRKVKKGVDLDLILDHVCEEWQAETENDMKELEAEDHVRLREMCQTAGMMDKDVKAEKLQVSRELLEWLSAAIQPDLNQVIVSMDYQYALQSECKRRSEKMSTRLSVEDVADDEDQGLYELPALECMQALAAVPLVQLMSEELKMKDDPMTMLTGAIDENFEVTGTVTNEQKLRKTYQTQSPEFKEHTHRYNDISPSQNEVPHKRRKITKDSEVMRPLILSSSVTSKHGAGTGIGREEDTRVEDVTESPMKSEPGSDDEFLLSGQPSSSFEQDLVRMSEQVAENIKRDISERLSPDPATTKVNLPSLQPILSLSQRSERDQYVLVDEHIVGQILPSKTDLKEELSMSWTPFPITAPEQVLTESISGQTGSLRTATIPPHNVVRSEQLLWNEPRERVFNTALDEASDWQSSSDTADDNFVPRELDQNASLVLKLGMTCSSPPHGKEKLQPIEDSNSNQLQALPMARQDAESMLKRHTSNAAVITSKLPLTTQQKTAPTFSASASLSSFLDLRGKRFKKPSLTMINHVASELADDPIQPTQECQTSDGQIKSPPAVTESQSCLQRFCPSEVLASLLPETEELAGPITIIVNSSLVQSHQRLTSFLEDKAGSKMTIIYRDFCQSVEVVPDIIVSPSGCIMYTNIQCLTQRSLPGQSQYETLSPIQQLISKLSASFDTIIILVVYQQSTDSNKRTVTMRSMTRFAAFCASLSTSANSIKPLWLPNTDSTAVTDTINAWTWAIIARSAVVDWAQALWPITANNKISFIQDETLWELFLRRAGLNPMAAQVVLSMLQKPSEVDMGCSNDNEDTYKASWGLSRFVRMLPKERERMFGQILGSRCVQAVNHVLESNTIESGKRIR